MFIYKILNKANGYSYIGQSKQPDRRFKHHVNKLNNLAHRNWCLQKAWNNYGFELFDFKIIECILKYDQDYINEREQWWIDHTKNLYNIQKDVSVMIYPNCSLHPYWKGKTKSQEVRNKISNGKKGKTCGKDNHFYGKHHTQKSKDKISKVKKQQLIDHTKHPLYKATIYKFENIKTNEIVSMTQYDFHMFLKEQTGYASRGNISSLIAGKLKTYKKFRLA
jgi:group I intron endonuclease